MSSKGYQAVSDQDYDHVGEPGEVFEDKRITIGKICNWCFITCLCCCCCLFLIPLGFSLLYGIDGLNFSSKKKKLIFK